MNKILFLIYLPWKVTEQKHNDNADEDACEVDLVVVAAVPA